MLFQHHITDPPIHPGMPYSLSWGFKINNFGLDAHQGHSKFEIFRPGKREILLFRSPRRKEFI